MNVHRTNDFFVSSLGEWWNANPIDVVRQATRTGNAPNVSDAYTINGQPGDLYNCSSKGINIWEHTHSIQGNRRNVTKQFSSSH